MTHSLPLRCLVFIFSVMFIFLTVTGLWPGYAGAAPPEKEIPSAPAAVELSYAPLVKKVAPAVVNIYAQRVVNEHVIHPFFNDPFFQQFFGRSPFSGMDRQRIEKSLGSGVIVDETGLIVTNAHVIRQAEDITAALPDGRQFPAKIVLQDDPSDLALIQISEEVDSLPTVSFKASDSLEVGDLVLAIGNPFGVGQTVTGGIISALARSSLNINDFNFFIQTDAAINPGNSGGPLVAMDGQVVGINTAIFSRDGGSLGIGFAVPSEVVASIIAAHRSGRYSEKGVIRPWLGVTVQDLTGEISRNLGLEHTLGALITAVHQASPFRESGLRQGDVIIRVDGHDIRSAAELNFRMTMIPVGQDTYVVYVREGKSKKAKIRTILPPEEPPRNLTLLEDAHPLQGATVGNLNPAFIAELGFKDLNTSGVAILKVETASRAAYAGLEPGLIIAEINGTAIKTVKDLKKNLAVYRPGDKMQITLLNRGRVYRLHLR